MYTIIQLTLGEAADFIPHCRLQWKKRLTGSGFPTMMRFLIWTRWKRRTEFDVSIRYSTTLYGDMYASLDYYVPFLLDEGDKVRVLYNPRLPREFRLPGPEGLLYGSLLGLGTLLLGGGAAVCARRRRRADARNES